MIISKDISIQGFWNPKVVWLSLGNQDLKFCLPAKNTGCPSPTDLWWTAAANHLECMPGGQLKCGRYLFAAVSRAPGQPISETLVSLTGHWDLWLFLWWGRRSSTVLHKSCKSDEVFGGRRTKDLCNYQCTSCTPPSRVRHLYDMAY
jgi:hypothetical protein